MVCISRTLAGRYSDDRARRTARRPLEGAQPPCWCSTLWPTSSRPDSRTRAH